MQPFDVHRGLVVPLDRPNVDTDQIIPKQFLKRIERTGFGDFLFYHWRFRPDGTPDPAFVLNDPAYRGATVLLARENFGSGSSREHAAWALRDYGFRAVLAPSFADIFYNNAVKNGLLPAQLSAEAVDALFARAEGGPYWVTIDLAAQTVALDDGTTYAFRIHPEHRRRLLAGEDDIGVTERYLAAIEAYERAHPLPPLAP
ncbi:MAG: 3-isopropylmalate dehydratase small subunit [Hydrogenibacillus schlegelii]|nr:3-isopropylmalate dehydratase small subunit [Hydrogenibacillus schlegelii]